jgi:hypothetical protein
MEELRRWLEDLVRQGLAASQQQTYGYWDRVAARMVDAQAPGAASRVRTLSHLPSMPDPSWARRMLEELGLLYLLVEAYGRLDELPEAVRADVTAQLGWPVAQEEVLRGPRTRGRWTVTGRVVEERESLTTQRTWLAGDDGTPALVLSFAPPGGMLDTSLVPGTVVDAELAFYPSAAPLRALVAERHGEEPAREAVGAASIDEAFGRRAAALAANPWLDRWPMALREADIVRIEEAPLRGAHGRPRRCRCGSATTPGGGSSPRAAAGRSACTASGGAPSCARSRSTRRAGRWRCERGPRRAARDGAARHRAPPAAAAGRRRG